MKLTIGKVYPVNRKVLKKYVDKQWTSSKEIYNDKNVKTLKITGENNDNFRDRSEFRETDYYYVNYMDKYSYYYLPADCLQPSRKDKLKRILKGV